MLNSRERNIFSIITVVHNDKLNLEYTLDSVSEQTFRGFEYVIVDGCSTDGTLELINKNKLIIDKWISEPDKGIYDAMNKGVNIAEGMFVFFLNAGDVFDNKNILKNIKEHLINNKNIDLIYGDVRLMLNDTCVGIRKHFKASKYKLLKNTINHQAIFTRRSIFNEIGSFNLKYRIKSDYDWVLRVFFSDSYDWKYLPIIVSRFDLNGKSSDLKLDLYEKRKILKDRYGLLYRIIFEIIILKKRFESFTKNEKKQDK